MDLPKHYGLRLLIKTSWKLIKADFDMKTLIILASERPIHSEEKSLWDDSQSAPLCLISAYKRGPLMRMLC